MIFDGMFGTSQSVRHIALKEQNPPVRNGPYPTEALKITPKCVNVKVEPCGKFPRGDAAAKVFIEVVGHECSS